MTSSISLKTKGKIIEEAEKLFIQNGYQSVSMNMIADKIKITKPALYYYFKNKEDLYSQILKNLFEEFHQEIDKALVLDKDLPDKLHNIARIYVSFSFKKKNFIRIVMQGLSHRDKKAIKKMMEAREKIISRIEPLVKKILFYNGDAKSDSRLATCMFLGAMNAVVAEKVMDLHKGGKLDVEQLADQIVLMLCPKKV